MRDKAPSRRQMLSASASLAGLATLPASAAGSVERLKITRIESFQVVVPMQPDIINSPEFGPDALTEFPSIPKFVLKIHTDSGVIGIGETERGLKPEVVRQNIDYLTGKNIFDLNLTRLGL